MLRAGSNQLTDEEVRAHRWLRGLATAYMQSRVLHEACERSVFTQLEGRPGTPEEVAARASLHPTGTRMLLEALAAMGLLTVENGVYSNTPVASRFLVEGTPIDQTEIVALYRRTTERWERLGEALYCGHTPRQEEDFDPRFIHAMHCTASVVAPRLVKLLDLEGVERLLDVGGGPGTYAIHFALARPNLRARVLDLEPVVSITREYAQLFGVEERLEARAGDYHTADLGSGWDLVLLSNVLHSNRRELCRALLGRVFEALRPGGQVVINDFVRSGRGDGPLAAALFALHMYLNTPGGDTYTEGELRAWLEETGFAAVRVEPLEGTDYTAVVGTRP